MFNVLYNRYIEQIKLHEIENYNKKHQDYLIRSGKLHNNPPSSATSNNRPQAKKVSYNNAMQKTKSNNVQNQRAYPVTNEGQSLSSIREKQNKGPSNLKQQRPIKANIHTNKLSINNNQRQQNPHPFNQPSHGHRTYNDEEKPNDHVIQNKKDERLIVKQQPTQSMGGLNQFPQQQEDVVLEQCPEGCGRRFKLSVLQKHVKICQKVFQAKRKAFKVDVVDDQAKKLAAKSSNLDQGTKKGGQEKVPKWKKQSQLLRKGLKAQNQGGNNQSVVIEPQEDDRIQCGGCGRKFNQKAAQKHIPSCIKRSKQKK